MPAGSGTFLFRQESTQRMRHKGRYEPIAPPYVSPAAPPFMLKKNNIFFRTYKFLKSGDIDKNDK